MVAGVAATVMQHGLLNVTTVLHWELGLVVIAAILFSTVSLALRYVWSRARSTFLLEHRSPVVVSAVWVGGVVAVLAFGPLLPDWHGEPVTRATAVLAWSELCVVLRCLTSAGSMTRSALSGGTNPAVVLVSSFAVMVLAGTLLLMLPRARAHPAAADQQPGAPPLVALFTATSASCVTGLTVVPTGSYWSRTGQVVILCLFQLGGLGIMTFGAFFALVTGRDIPMRESATLGEMMESSGLGQVRRLVLAIIAFTFSLELLGALLLSGLWWHLPLGERAYYSVFHSVSAFCNAGFTLTPDSFAGMGTRWQVWGVAAGLIVLGGLGFAVHYNIALAARSRLRPIEFQPLFQLPRRHVRLSLTSRLVLTTSTALLLGGVFVYYLLESAGRDGGDTVGCRIADAWFQAVTFRTAGFQTVDHAELQPATKLFGIGLMFIGASPGSTGGGVKTVCFAVGLLAVVSILRGRRRVEVAARTIPETFINRALAILALGMLTLMAATLLLVLFEDRPDRFLDHLYEAASAFGTVGVSTGLTPELSAPSKLVIVVTMFLGRVGPLTLLMALAGRVSEARYQYPFEQLSLG